MTNMVTEASIATDSGMTATERETVQVLLAWYAAMGADEAIGDMPVDCFAAPAAAVSTPPRVQPRPRPAAAQVAAAGDSRIDLSQANTLAAMMATVTTGASSVGLSSLYGNIVVNLGV